MIVSRQLTLGPVCVCARSTYDGSVRTQPPSSPTLLYSLALLEAQLKSAYRLVTEGKFSDALKVGLEHHPFPRAVLPLCLWLYEFIPPI